MVYFLILDGGLLITFLILFFCFRARANKITAKNVQNPRWNPKKDFGQWWKVNWYQIFAYLAIAFIIIIIMALVLMKT